MKPIPKVRHIIKRRNSIPNIPYDEPLTPGLRDKEHTKTEAIGFTAHLAKNENDDEW